MTRVEGGDLTNMFLAVLSCISLLAYLQSLMISIFTVFVKMFLRLTGYKLVKFFYFLFISNCQRSWNKNSRIKFQQSKQSLGDNCEFLSTLKKQLWATINHEQIQDMLRQTDCKISLQDDTEGCQSNEPKLLVEMHYK